MSEVSTKEFIPLSIPHINGNEWKYVKDCLDTGWVSSVGAYVNKFEEAVAHYAGARYGVACVNGTSALHVALRLSGVGDNDYVIVPNITFIASVNSIKYTNADPILMDVNTGNWQMDLDLLEQFLHEETYQKDGYCYHKKNDRRIPVIMPVHVLGNICDMDRLVALAKQFNLTVVEDSTEALGSTYKGQHSGTFGQFGTFSFNGNKIITTGGGGVIVTNNEELAKQAKHLTTQAKVDPMEYIHDEIGYNYRLVNVLAAIGLAQMEQLPEFIQKKKKIVQYYQDHLSDLEAIGFQEVSPEVSTNGWLYTIKADRQKELISYLNAEKVMCRPFWVPMNQLRMFQQDIYYSLQDNANTVYQNCLSIPSSVNLREDQLERVVETIRAFYQ